MKNLKGVFTALVTPFYNGKVDYESLKKIVVDQINQGIDGFVINGTTGESPTISGDEVEEIFKFVLPLVSKHHVLIVGAGGNCTEDVIESAKKAEKLGADAILSVVPYYNKPPQRGLVQHFQKIANAVNIPVILYNVPGRTVTSLSLDSIKELAKHPQIKGIKEASGNIQLASEIAAGLGPDFVLLSGDDETYVDFLKVGGHGVISVATHVIGNEMVQMKKWVIEGKAEQAQQSLQTFLPLIKLLFAEANPIPVKAALKLMGLMRSAELRLPLVELEEGLCKKLKNELIERKKLDEK